MGGGDRLGGGGALKLPRGAVVLVSLDPTLGHEQAGLRPCVVVSDPEVTQDQRYPLLCVVPVTSTPGRGALYPELSAGESGLKNRSWALADQLRSVDKRRVRRWVGVLAPIPPADTTVVLGYHTPC
jgi:mRNA interferase MazF